MQQKVGGQDTLCALAVPLTNGTLVHRMGTNRLSEIWSFTGAQGLSKEMPPERMLKMKVECAGIKPAGSRG